MSMSPMTDPDADAAMGPPASGELSMPVGVQAEGARVDGAVATQAVTMAEEQAAPAATRLTGRAVVRVGAQPEVEADVRIDVADEAATVVEAAAVEAAEMARVGREAGIEARKPVVRRGPADPVRALMHRHRELCERAVDPLEIAAGLEAHGVTDRAAARFRHRDVFSLAEELYARVPRDTAPSGTVRETPEPGAPWWAVIALLPGAVTGAVLLGLRHVEEISELALVAVGALAAPAALKAAFRHGPLHTAGRTGGAAARLAVCWLLAYAVLGQGLLTQALTGGPDGMWPADTGPLLGLTLAVGPASWCAHLYAVRARRRLAVSRGLDDFAQAVRPLLIGTFALQLLALSVLLWPTRQTVAVVALGALLYLARLVTVHGGAGAAVTALGAAAAAEVLALCSVFAARLPGCGFLARPVEAAVQTWGTEAVPALACGAAALGLFVHAGVALSRASAHSRGADAAGAPSH